MRSIKIKLYLFSLMSFLFSCQQLTDSSEISLELQKISQSEDCEISFVDQRIDNTSTLTLTMNCNQNESFFPGKILFETFNALRLKGINRDFYSVKSSNGDVYGTVSSVLLKEVNNKLALFQRDLSLTQNNGNEKVFNRLIDTLKNTIDPVWYNTLFKQMALNKDKKWEFNGFMIKTQDSASFVTYSSKLNEEAVFWVSYKLENNHKIVHEDDIYGIGLLPVK